MEKEKKYIPTEMIKIISSDINDFVKQIPVNL